MKILAIDTVTDFCSVALLDEQVTASRQQCLAHGHTQILFELLQELLQERQITVKDLDGLAFSNGPGSFTGIRLTMSIMKAFCLVKPMLVSVKSYLWLMAVEVYLKTQVKEILVIQDAKMKEWYVGHYSLIGNEWRGQDQLLSKEALEQKLNQFSEEGILTGNGAEPFVHLRKVFLQTHVNICTMLALAAQELKTLKTYDIDPKIPSPCYLRNESAWQRQR